MDEWMVKMGMGFEAEGGDETGGGDAGAATEVAEGSGDGASAAQDDAGGAKGASEGSEGGEAQAGESRAQQRIRQLANEKRALVEQVEQFRAQVEELSTPADKRAAAERAKEEAKRFYQDPANYVQQTREQLRQEFQQVLAQQQDLAQYQTGMEALKASPGWSKELNDAMVAALERYGLTNAQRLAQFGRSKALKFAYEAATGKEWGHWTQDGYNTRKTKERLSRPGSGGSGAAANGKTVSPEEYDRAMLELSRKSIDPDEQSREMERLNAGLDAWAAAQG